MHWTQLHHNTVQWWAHPNTVMLRSVLLKWKISWQVTFSHELTSVQRFVISTLCIENYGNVGISGFVYEVPEEVLDQKFDITVCE
jgi:hypothetical protein